MRIHGRPSAKMGQIRGLKEKLDDAIVEMKKDGSLNDLIRKWFGEIALTF